MDQRKSKPYQIWMAEVSDPKFPRFKNKDHSQILFHISQYEPDEAIQRLNQGLDKDSEFALEFGLKPRMDLLRNLLAEMKQDNEFKNRKSWKPVKEEIKKILNGDIGLVGELNQKRPIYSVYVINLVNEENPQKWVYVGETAHPPKERFLQHKDPESKLGRRIPREFGTGLNISLMKEFPITRFRADSLWLENHVAETLESRGFKVEGGH